MTEQPPKHINDALKDALDDFVEYLCENPPKKIEMVRVDPTKDPHGRAEITAEERFSESYIRYVDDADFEDGYYGAY